MSLYETLRSSRWEMDRPRGMARHRIRISSKVGLYRCDDLSHGMSDSASPSASVSLSEPTDIPAVLNRAGIDHVGVHDHRLLAIYHTGIFNMITEPESVSNTHAFEI